jgi:hypothetical protein
MTTSRKKAKPKPGEWQPIESAPKQLRYARSDGDRILAYVPRLGLIATCYWYQPKGSEGNFIEDGGNPVFPSHWMPLPERPKL